MFWIVVFFGVTTLFATFRGNQTTPLWVFGMYSEKFEPTNTYNTFLMFNQSGDKIPFHTKKGFKTRFYIQAPLNYYHQTLLLGKDPRMTFFNQKIPSLNNILSQKLFTQNISSYGDWLKKYLQSVDNHQIDTLFIVNYEYQFLGFEKQNFKKDTLYVF